MMFIKKILRPIRNAISYYHDFTTFMISIYKIISSYHYDIKMRQRLLFELNRFIKSLNSKQNFLKTTTQSKEIYQAYDDREIIAYYKESGLMLMNNKLVSMTYKEEREIHLSYIFSEIDSILIKKDKVSILEVGCGNCINIYEILKRYGDKVAIVGIDISENRINNGKKYFNGDLNPAILKAASITDGLDYKDDYFDIVYSMFCLEQIAYDCKSAVQEMYRVSSEKLIMLEPVFENATLLQKIYLIHSDHTRILLRSIEELNLPLIKNEILKFQCNPSNQSSLLIVEKLK